MAERFAEIEAPPVIEETEARINDKFDYLIFCLNKRRAELIAQFRQRQGEIRAAETGRIRTLEQLTESKAQLQAQLKENVLHSMRERIIEEMDAKIKDLQVAVKEIEYTFECDIKHLEEAISVLGHLVERELEPIPNYPALKQPRISVGDSGREIFHGGLNIVGGIAFDERTQRIYVVQGDMLSSCRTISVFSITGEFIHAYEQELLTQPSDIAVRGDDVYVSSIDTYQPYNNIVYHFKLPTFKLVAKARSIDKGVHFSYPRKIAIATDGSVFVADSDRIVVMNAKLQHKHIITHDSLKGLCDVKLLKDEIYVLSELNNTCVLVFSQNGEKIRTILLTSPDGKAQVKRAKTFCLDKRNNFLIGDNWQGNIKVFSKDGALLHILGGKVSGKEILPAGIVVTNNNNIICGSNVTHFGLHIF